MTTVQPAARPYARALWELTKERGQVDAVGRELGKVAEAIGQTPVLRDLFLRPWVAASLKEGVVREVAEGAAEDLAEASTEAAADEAGRRVKYCCLLLISYLI